MELLSIRDATVWRGTTKVFDGFGIDIELGQQTAILGPNGAGKTTLLKVLNRELYPIPSPTGHTSIFGRQRWNVWELRERLGIVSTDLQHDFSESSTGRQVVLSGFHAALGTFDHQTFSDDDERLADRLIEELGVSPLADRPYGAMSTGQQRRFLLARALVNKPAALVLDEPSAGLDVPAIFQCMNLIRSQIALGTTLVLVTHHVHEIVPEIESIVLLKEGRIFAAGDKRDMLTSQRLSELFEVAVDVTIANGFYHVTPADL